MPTEDDGSVSQRNATNDRSPREPVVRSWRETDRFIPRRVVRPARRLMELEVSAAILMFVAAVIALVWANSPWADSYVRFWGTRIELSAAGLSILHFDLHGVVTNGLMTIFFLVVALEIKREWVTGALRDRRTAALPIVAAAGGMVVPALIYTAWNAGGPASHGWGIPMATDIAFAVAVVSLVGSRVPAGARLFLLTLAIADDLGAIVVIAFFYSGGLSLFWLFGALAMCFVAWVLQRVHVRSISVFIFLGVLCWYMLLQSGVNSTMAGVAFGFLTPARSFLPSHRFPAVANSLVAQIGDRAKDGILTRTEAEDNANTLREIVRLSRETQAPLDRVAWRLGGWSAFVVVPIFALANAGVHVPRTSPIQWLTDPVVLGVGVGLVLGKTIGVFGTSWLLVKLGWARMPQRMTNRHLFGVSICAGVGFTVALFVASLAFTDPQLGNDARLGIMTGSLLSGVLGYLMLRYLCGPSPKATTSTNR